MRWEQLFAELEAGFAAQEAAGELAESGSRSRVAVGEVRLGDRLRAATGQVVRLRCRGAGDVAGRLVDVGVDWLLLADDHGRELLVATASVSAVAGLGAATAPVDEPGAVVRAWDLRRAVRGLARDRSPLQCGLLDGSVLTGTVDRVGADYFELAEHPLDQPRRRGAVTSVRAVVLAGVAVLTSVLPGTD